MTERGTGAGWLSGAAEARLATPARSVPLALPDLTDPVAVSEWRRAVNEDWGEADDSSVPATRVDFGGVSCLVAGPAEAPVLVYAHGGGYVLGSAATAIPITARLAVGLRVVSLDYRQAPEHAYPASVEDVVAVCAAVATQGVPYGAAGDSAGGGLVLAGSVLLRDRGIPGPAALALLSPHLDHAMARRHGPEITERAALSRAYVGDADPEDPGVSPLRAALHNLPPVLIQASDEEALVSQAVILSRRLKTAGVTCDLDLWRGLWHAWQYHRDLPEADLALAEVSNFILSFVKPV